MFAKLQTVSKQKIFMGCVYGAGSLKVFKSVPATKLTEMFGKVVKDKHRFT